MNVRHDPRASAWPWIGLVGIALAFALIYVRAAPAAPGVAAPGERVVLVQTVVVTPTPTRTPAETPTARIVIATPTPAADPTATMPPCWDARGGQACIRYARTAPTATVIPWCSRVEDHGVAVVCRRDTDGTEREQEVGG